MTIAPRTSFKIILALLFFCNNYLIAQKFSFFKYSVENGLPQSTVFDVFQDHNHYLWLATDGGGLVRYDGHFFKTYNTKDGLSGNVVRKIVEDQDHCLWLATNKGLEYFCNNKFGRIKLLKDKEEVYAVSLHIRNNKIYVATSGEGILEVDLKTKNTKQFNADNAGIGGNFIFDFAEDNKHNVWTANFSGGLSCISPEGKISSYTSGVLSAINCLSLNRLKDGRILCGTQGSGFFIFDPEKKIFIENTFYLQGLTVWDAGYYNDQLYVATQEQGIYLLGKEFYPKINFTKENGLPSNQFYKVFADEENDLWFSSSGSGIVKFTGFSFLNFDRSQINTSAGINAIYQKEKNKFWVGSNEGVYEFTETKEYNYAIKRLEEFGSEIGAISSFCKDDNGNIYVGTKKTGLYIINLQQQIINITQEGGLIGNAVSSVICRPKDNSVWVGTNAGVSIAKNGEIVNISESNGLINNEVQKLGLVNDYVIAATYGGLMVFSEASMQSFDKKEGLNEKRINTFCADKNGKLYLGTFGDGIYVSDMAVGKIKQFKKFSISGLNFGNIYSLTFCNDTLLAATSDKGLSLITLINEKVKSVYLFNNQNGFEGIESNQNANLLSDNGKLFLGTVTGMSVLNLKELSLKLKSPKVTIDSIKINDKAYSSVPSTLAYDLNSIELQVWLIGFSNVAQNRLEYRLEGHDANWSTMASNVFKEYGYVRIKYNKLTPGIYHLKLRGVCGEDVAANETEIIFEILPPFWTTWWFKVLAVLIVIAAVFLFIRVREGVLKEKNRVLEETVTERTKEILIQKQEIEQKNEELNQQNEEILAQRDEIEHQSELLSHKNREITDSINYAQQIQNSLLPDIIETEENLKNAFIIFKPKDIVSGDFYWMKSISQEELYVVAADCTGHGVPGAFMSLIGIEKLNEAFEKYRSPAKILTHLNNSVKNTLKQNSSSNAKDGMDLAFVKIEGNKISYAGANRPVYILKKDANDIEEIKADKVAIGGFTEFDHQFAEHQLTLSQGDTIYIFSDGYADQFGGDKGKKLMTKKFKQMLLDSRSKSMQEQKTYLDMEFETWKGFYEQVDDVLVIAYRF